MARNIKSFSTLTEYQSAELVRPAVSYIEENDSVHYDDVIPPVSAKYIATFSDGTTSSAACETGEYAWNSVGPDDIPASSNPVSIVIGDCVTSAMFGTYNCTSLKTIVFGSGVTTMGKNSLNGCSSLESITVLNPTPPSAPISFNDTNDCPIYVLAEAVDTYKASWSSVASRIQAIPII